MKKIIATIAAITALAVPTAAFASNGHHSPNEGQTNAWCNVYKNKDHTSRFLDFALTYWNASQNAAREGNTELAAAFYSYARHYLDLHVAYTYICA